MSVTRRAVSLGILLTSTSALAQVDIAPPLPNVLLLLDTSGSMEYMPDGTLPTCAVGEAPNRWRGLVNVLTGTLNNAAGEAGCEPILRASAAYINEYSVAGNPPPDWDYSKIPHHYRPVSNNCVIGPGADINSIKWHNKANPALACVPTQSTNGILDAYQTRVRFGLMTFDTEKSAAIDHSGTWSYFPNWAGNDTNPSDPASAFWKGCIVEQPFEVGARNQNAPLWEGRLQWFNLPTLGGNSLVAHNEVIQNTILATRGFGPTPLAGQLTDAEYFLLNDGSPNPDPTLPAGTKWSPAADPYFQGDCRPTYVVVLSDGEPNLDGIEYGCEEPGGTCPFSRTWDIAERLRTNPGGDDHKIHTFVIGFGLNKDLTGQVAADINGDGDLNCQDLSLAELTGPLCTNVPDADTTLKACCNLGRLAHAGSLGIQDHLRKKDPSLTGIPACPDGYCSAFYATDEASLRSAFGTIFGIITSGSTSRTYPVFASAGGAGGGSYQFNTSLTAPPGAGLWTGNLERKRYECDGGVAVLRDIDPEKGDDFAANINEGSIARKFWTVAADVSGVTRYSQRTIRPYLATSDGFSDTKGTALDLSTASVFATAVPQEALDETGTNTVAGWPLLCSAQLAAATEAECAKHTLLWTTGEAVPGSTNTRDRASCTASGLTCSEFGAVYHAAPVAVPSVPNESIEDESYFAFQNTLKEQNDGKPRDPVLYAATTDGQLHAFKVGPAYNTDPDEVDSLENNELWSFFPPHVLPRLSSTVGQEFNLHDGGPVVRNVIMAREPTADLDDPSVWRTILVGSGGSGGSYYYALDVTDPLTPKFLWQISTDDAGNALFGSSAATAAITTLRINDNGTGARTVGVAILPGGSSATAPGECARAKTNWIGVGYTSAGVLSHEPRDAVRCWAQRAARSVTVVRLSDGKILATLRRQTPVLPDLTADCPTCPAGITIDTPFDSPMSGVPVPFPARPGDVASRVYIGDADGTLWRVELSSSEPAQWKAEIAWDAYSLATDTSLMGEPIETRPAMSIDGSGNPVLLFSTGDQDQFTTSTPQTRVWSITDKPYVQSGANFRSIANWRLEFTDGKRVTGPISLFDSVAYFSTFTPSNSVCSDGYGSIWGVDYLNACSTSPASCSTNLEDATYNPIGKNLKDPDDPTDGYIDERQQEDGVTVFGVAIAEVPTCYSTSVVSDPYAGSHTTVSSASETVFQLVYQTGAGGEATENSQTKSRTETLPSPKPIARIESWARVIED